MVGGFYNAAQGPSGKSLPADQMIQAAGIEPKRSSRVGVWVSLGVFAIFLTLVLALALHTF